MKRTIDPSFSTRPISQWMTGPQSSLIGYATNGDDPENGGGGPKPASSAEESSAFITDFSPNLHPIPASEGITKPQIMFWSEDRTTVEFKGERCTFFDIGQLARDTETGKRRAVQVSVTTLPFELSFMLYASGHEEYVLENVDDITFCPYIVMSDMDRPNYTHLPSAAIYIQDPTERARKLYINLCKPVGVRADKTLEFVLRSEAELFPDVIDGAVRLHIMTNVIRGREPEEHLELSYIRKRSIPSQISAIDAITDIYEMRGDLTEGPYIYLKQLRRELAQELKQL